MRNIKQVVRVVDGKSFTTYEKKDATKPYPDAGRGKMKAPVERANTKPAEELKNNVDKGGLCLLYLTKYQGQVLMSGPGGLQRVLYGYGR